MARSNTSFCSGVYHVPQWTVEENRLCSTSYAAGGKTMCHSGKYNDLQTVVRRMRAYGRGREGLLWCVLSLSPFCALGSSCAQAAAVRRARSFGRTPPSLLGHSLTHARAQVRKKCTKGAATGRARANTPVVLLRTTHRSPNALAVLRAPCCALAVLHVYACICAHRAALLLSYSHVSLHSSRPSMCARASRRTCHVIAPAGTRFPRRLRVRSRASAAAVP